MPGLGFDHGDVWLGIIYGHRCDLIIIRNGFKLQLAPRTFNLGPGSTFRYSLWVISVGTAFSRFQTGMRFRAICFASLLLTTIDSLHGPFEISILLAALRWILALSCRVFPLQANQDLAKPSLIHIDLWGGTRVILVPLDSPSNLAICFFVEEEPGSWLGPGSRYCLP